MKWGPTRLRKCHSAEGAPLRRDRDLAQALRALLRRRISRRFAAASSRDDRVDRQHDEVVDGRRNEQERENGVDEIADWKIRLVNVQHERGKIMLSDHELDHRRELFVYQRLQHHAAWTDGDADR